MNFIMVLYGEIIGDSKHMVFSQSYMRKIGEEHTEELVSDTVIEAAAFIEEVLKPVSYRNPFCETYKHRIKQE